MKASVKLVTAAIALLAVLAGCERGHTPSVGGIVQTKYPGQVSAGGATSGAIIAATPKPVTDATYAGGTPGAYQAMREGTVDEAWAQAHHAIWYEQVKNGTATDPAHRPHPDAQRGPAPRPGPAH